MHLGKNNFSVSNVLIEFRQRCFFLAFSWVKTEMKRELKHLMKINKAKFGLNFLEDIFLYDIFFYFIYLLIIIYDMIYLKIN